ncbi:MAG TPA: cation diffusion facilitator family transporter [Deltaproteobacteria bacterium]|nr:cation diffusion facilitator family transporter [Deltaproteobacteria bacterium]
MIKAADREKRWVALTSAMAAVVLTGTKAVVGVLTGSLGILSEAAHSALDLLAAAVTYLSVRISGKKADLDHTYGHGKVENLSALFETLLLLLTCIWIISEAGQRLLGGKQVHIDANIWAFLVIFLSIFIDVGRSRALMHAARKHNSQALEADAVHFSTDVWSSCVVLLGLACVWLSERLGMPWLEKADSVAALGVAAIVVGVCFRLGWKSVNALLDAVPPGLQGKIETAAAAIPGISAVKRVRVRSSGPDLFADITVVMDPEMTIEAGHRVADVVEDHLRAGFPNMDIIVHVEPERKSK